MNKLELTKRNHEILCFQVHYLMCLSANYAHIKDHEKLQDFQELQYFTTGESEMTALAGKDRF